MTDEFNQQERDAIKLDLQNQYFNINSNQFHPPYENNVAPYNDPVLDLNQYFTNYLIRFGKFLRFVIIWEVLACFASSYLTLQNGLELFAAIFYFEDQF